MSVSQNKISDLKWKPDPKKIRTQEIYKDENLTLTKQVEGLKEALAKKSQESQELNEKLSTLQLELEEQKKKINYINVDDINDDDEDEILYCKMELEKKNK